MISIAFTTFARGNLNDGIAETFNHNIGSGPNRVLYVFTAGSTGQSGVISCTLDDVELTQVASLNTTGITTGGGNLTVYRLINPQDGGPGFNVIKMTCGNVNASAVHFAVTLTGVNQTTPERTPTTSEDESTEASSTVTATPSSEVGDLVFALYGAYLSPAPASPTLGSGQTSLHSEEDNNLARGSLSWKAGEATSTSVSGTSTGTKGIVGMAVIPSPFNPRIMIL